jgi:long-chain acyl-CoA synthetase
MSNPVAERLQPNDARLLLTGQADLTRGAALERARAAAPLFRSAGLEAGDTVLVALTDETALATTVLACWYAGLTVWLLTRENTAAEMARYGALATPRAAIVDEDLVEAWGLDEHLEHVWRHSPQAPPSLFDRLLGRRPAAPCWPALLDGLAPGEPTPVGPDHVLVLLCTSGSTGRPKLVPLRSRNYIAQAETTCRALGMAAGSRYLTVAPMNHVDGIAGVFYALWSELVLVRVEPFSVSRLPESLDAFYRHRVSHAMVVPTLLALWLRLGEDLHDAFDYPELQVLMSTAAPLPPNLWASFEAASGVSLWNCYGSTEAGNVTFANSTAQRRASGSIGTAVDARFVLLLPDGSEAPAGSAGELHISGPSVFSGYIRGPDALVEHAGRRWYPTGDLATQHGDEITLVGRARAMVLVGGRTVFPVEVAAALLACPGVIEVVVLGLPDPTWGEVLAAAVMAPDGLDPNQLAAHARNHLAPYKVPRRIEVWPDLPRGATGKPDQAAIRRAMSATDGSGPSQGDVENTVLALAAKAFSQDPAALTLASAAGNTPGWDSMAHLELVLALESAFALTLTPAQIVGLSTLSDAARLVVQRLT